MKKGYIKQLSNSGLNKIGIVVAEKDTNLSEYYWNREKYVDKAESFNYPSTFYVGPKGIGKSAILQMVTNDNFHGGHRLINVCPDDLAFSAIANLKVQDSLLPKVNNQWLFKTLWDYVLAIEILHQEYTNETTLWEKVKGLFKGESEKRAYRLINSAFSTGSYKNSMTDRIIELIKELEVTLSTHGTNVSGKIVLNEQNKNASLLLNDINHIVKEIGNLLDHKYYVLIDDLDSYWENDPLQNAYISALFDSVRKFNGGVNVKFIAALRKDILGEITIQDKDKVWDQIENVSWAKLELKSMLEKRLVTITKLPYAKIWNGFFDGDYFDYMFKHTNETPRELMRLCDLCYQTAIRKGSNLITKSDIDDALLTYSEEQLENIDSRVKYRYRGLKSIVRKMFYGLEKEFTCEYFQSRVLEMQTDPKLMRDGSECIWIQGFESKDVAIMLLELEILLYKANRTAKPEKVDPTRLNEISEECYFSINQIYAPGLRCLGA